MFSLRTVLGWAAPPIRRSAASSGSVASASVPASALAPRCWRRVSVSRRSSAVSESVRMSRRRFHPLAAAQEAAGRDSARSPFL